MKDYSDFTPVELAQDEDFIQWALSGKKEDQHTNHQLFTWISQHPEKKEVVDEALRIVRAINNERQFFLHDSKQQEIWMRIEASVSSEIKSGRFSTLAWYGIAASILVIAVAAFSLLEYGNINLPGKQSAAEIRKADGEHLLKYSNESNMPHSLVLEDGTVVTLQPHSVIEYPQLFSATRRDVYLSGEAFFNVARNPQKPFSVYANEIVTRVLGTSFTVRAYEKERDVVVAVKTGKVSVFRDAENQLLKDSTISLEGTLLTPNQQIVFSRDKARMLKSLVEEPLALPAAADVDEFRFVDTPIREVFARLEKAYGVVIIFDEEIMADCLFNTSSLKGLTFYDKLRLVCKGVNAKYEILDANIIITGSGCQ
ncbi:MAG: FecR domain-containing protein [Chryseolinea sp.]